ncbi:capsular polysaccharide biosynthesis protein CapF [Rummeliibacillus sp. SL167]|uniref:capsular polysaccharide biosynthesis protein CapF n=1 Tax=Rummeliibacillus sp. SL167 TaxID=2579792 RepID=UPI0011B5455A|nr:capsular polysaccharide biosynthesis protein CapF [Rummeliibacillus sp. SL167]
MKILVTGAKGFIGKNLIAELKNKGFTDIFEYTRESDPSLLDQYTKECDFVFHLAGVNRPKNEKEFLEGNYHLTDHLLKKLKQYENKAPVLFTSSIQAEQENLYGKSKRVAENLLLEYSSKTGAEVYIYRLANVFGKWSKPNYNTVIATFCHNISRNIDIQISNPEAELTLCYIDDVIDEFLKLLAGRVHAQDHFCAIPITYKVKLGKLAELIKSFRESRKNLTIPNMEDALTKKLYSTYLSFLPEKEFSYHLKMNADHRGAFTEFLRTPERGQISVNISKPGITKGNHWHHTKNEKFLVVSGEGLIRFRKLDSHEIIEYRVSGEKLEVVDVPTGYTHSIVNVGDRDLVTVMWVNECFEPDKPDTYFQEV